MLFKYNFHLRIKYMMSVFQ